MSSDFAQVLIFVGYMRRYAPAFELAKGMISSMKNIDYVRVRDIIGPVSQPDLRREPKYRPSRQNYFFVNQSGLFPLKFDDFSAEVNRDRLARGRKIAETALDSLASNPRDVDTYRLLGSLGLHDLSAMRELIGLPKSCFAASRSSTGRFITAMLEYEGFTALYETGIDQVAKFDAHIKVHGEGKRVKVTWDT